MRRLSLPSLLLVLLGCGLAPAIPAADEPAPAPAVTAPAPTDAPAATAAARTLVVLGDSVTAGFGLKKSDAYPAVLQATLTARNWGWTVVNAGTSGDTTKDALNRLDWLWGQQRHVDVLVIALGGNDGLRGLAVGEMRNNLDAIIGNARFKYPEVKIVLAGMLAPPELGKEYGDAFAAVFPELAKKDRVALVPFLLAGVAGIDKLNQKDKVHPTALGHKLVADNVWQVLEPLVRPATGPTPAATPEEWDNKTPPPPPVVPSTAVPGPIPDAPDAPAKPPKRPKAKAPAGE